LRSNSTESETYSVLRFWNNEVLGQTEQVIEMILLEIAA
jgi:very-short-patch-repair endonuclease